jgi:hypothetical protein
MLNELINYINTRAKTAGFESPVDGKLLLSNDDNWPGEPLENQLCYWYRDFASILLVNISCETVDEAWELARHAETYLDASLVQREKNGSIIDGYLVLAITNMNDSLKPFIGAIEKDTRFVRKHVVFQGDNGWERCQRISPLGLMSSFDEVTLKEFIPNNDKSSELLELLSNLGSTEIARQHGNEWNLNE